MANAYHYLTRDERWQIDMMKESGAAATPPPVANRPAARPGRPAGDRAPQHGFAQPRYPGAAERSR